MTILLTIEETEQVINKIRDTNIINPDWKDTVLRYFPTLYTRDKAEEFLKDLSDCMDDFELRVELELYVQDCLTSYDEG